MAKDSMTLSPEAIRAELQRILGSEDFDASERNKRFLAYVVNETLDGRADRIKGYSIATSVFGRADSFDAQTDPIVRIEARRLRRSLERYYLMAGKTADLRITFPKGSYVPTFDATCPMPTAPGRPAALTPAMPRHVHGPGPSILVANFDAEGDQSAYPNFSRGFTRHLVVGLTRFTNLVVFGPDAASGLEAQAHVEQIRPETGADLVLTGGTVLSADSFCIEALLIDAKSGRSLWAETFERPMQPAQIIAVRNEVANRVARTLAQPYGVIFRRRSLEAEGIPPEMMSSYDSVIQFYQYWRTFDRDMHLRARECLEKTVERDPFYAEAFACLSQLYSNEFRFGIAPDPHMALANTSALERAGALAHRAIELAPHSSRAFHALGLAEWLMQRTEQSIDALERGFALNPNDTEIMSELGLRYTMRTDWVRGVSLLRESFARNPAQPGSYRVGLMLYLYAHGEYDLALIEARRLNAPGVVPNHIAVAIAAAKAGRLQEARDAVAQIGAIDPDYGARAATDLARRNLHPDLVTMVLDGLRGAGLRMPENAAG